MPFQSSYSFNLFTKRFLILHQNEQLVPLLIINHSLENTKLSCLTTTKEYFFLLLELWQNLVRKKLLEMTIYHTLIKLILQNLIEDKLLIPLAFYFWLCPLHSFGFLLMALRLLTSRYFFLKRMDFGVTFMRTKENVREIYDSENNQEILLWSNEYHPYKSVITYKHYQCSIYMLKLEKIKKRKYR